MSKAKMIPSPTGKKVALPPVRTSVQDPTGQSYVHEACDDAECEGVLHDVLHHDWVPDDGPLGEWHRLVGMLGDQLAPASPHEYRNFVCSDPDCGATRIEGRDLVEDDD